MNTILFATFFQKALKKFIHCTVLQVCFHIQTLWQKYWFLIVFCCFCCLFSKKFCWNIQKTHTHTHTRTRACTHKISYRNQLKFQVINYCNVCANGLYIHYKSNQVKIVNFIFLFAHFIIIFLTKLMQEFCFWLC